jgi:hypothetical protein
VLIKYKKPDCEVREGVIEREGGTSQPTLFNFLEKIFLNINITPWNPIYTSM